MLKVLRFLFKEVVNIMEIPYMGERRIPGHPIFYEVLSNWDHLGRFNCL